MTDPFFKEMVKIVKKIAPTWCMWDMHTLMQQVHEEHQSKKPPCFKIQDGTPTDMMAMLSLWQHNPEGVPTTIQQEDDGSLNTSDVDIWMWLRATTPTKGMMVRQHILQLFGEASQWTSLVDVTKLPAPSGSEMWNSIRAVYKPRSQPSSEILMKDLAIWLGKQVGVTLTHACSQIGGVCSACSGQDGPQQHLLTQEVFTQDSQDQGLSQSPKMITGGVHPTQL